MAKDQSVNSISSTVKTNDNDQSLCSGSSTNQDQHTPTDIHLTTHQNSGLTPLRQNYNSISPSTSSSAPGTVLMPSSLTTVSSSPSNHPSPQNRGDNTTSFITECYSPQTGSITQLRNLENASGLKPKRGRPPKPKLGKSGVEQSKTRQKRESKAFLSSLNCDRQSNVQLSSWNSLVPGGLKMRLRRDVSFDDPICGKKSRSRKSTQKSSVIFRIVESWCDADAPGGLAAKSNAISPTGISQASGGFRVGDVVWAKLAGYPYWPSRIGALYNESPSQVAQISPKNENCDSFVVGTTPADPSLSSGFTAKVEWFAWHQCSYLSCAKLFPFQENFERLYNPKTRVKNYSDAVKMAQSAMAGSITQSMTNSRPQSEIPSYSPSTSVSLISHLDQKRLEVLSPLGARLPFVPSDKNQFTDACPLDLRLTFPSATKLSLIDNLESVGNPHFPLPNLTIDAGDFCHPSSQFLDPLPQLDVSGLNDINSGVPTFSEDEDEPNVSFANRLKSQLGSIEM